LIIAVIIAVRLSCWSFVIRDVAAASTCGMYLALRLPKKFAPQPTKLDWSSPQVVNKYDVQFDKLTFRYYCLKD
jgi:hypothetical protein